MAWNHWTQSGWVTSGRIGQSKWMGFDGDDDYIDLWTILNDLNNFSLLIKYKTLDTNYILSQAWSDAWDKVMSIKANWSDDWAIYFYNSDWNSIWIMNFPNDWEYTLLWIIVNWDNWYLYKNWK